MAYQFIHIETYAKVASRNKKKLSAIAVARECERHDGACPHIQSPMLPKHLFGTTPTKAIEIAEKQASKATDRAGRAIRKDAQIIMSGVASYPVPCSELDPSSYRFKYWLRLTHQFLREKYGKQYISLVLHLDEGWPHVHFYVVPDLSSQNFLTISSVHPGIKARESVKENKNAKLKMRAYKEAMRKFQDDYYSKVGIKCGLTRDGPKRRRLTRQEWQTEKAASLKLARVLNATEHHLKRLEKIKAKVSAKEQRFNHLSNDNNNNNTEYSL